MFVLHILRLHVLFGSFKLADDNGIFSIITLLDGRDHDVLGIY